MNIQAAVGQLAARAFALSTSSHKGDVQMKSEVAQAILSVFAPIVEALEKEHSDAVAEFNKQRNGNWMDQWCHCKVCDGSIPEGHRDNCDIWKLESQLADVSKERDESAHQVEALCNLNANIADTLRARGFVAASIPLDERVIAMAQALDAANERERVLREFVCHKSNCWLSRAGNCNGASCTCGLDTAFSQPASEATKAAMPTKPDGWPDVSAIESERRRQRENPSGIPFREAIPESDPDANQAAIVARRGF